MVTKAILNIHAWRGQILIKHLSLTLTTRSLEGLPFVSHRNSHDQLGLETETIFGDNQIR